jgi:ribonucleoside-diphosphate reductase alpha chain
MSFIYNEAFSASGKLADERGVFPNWKRSVLAKKGKNLRNATLTSIAPTGTISIIAGTSSGIEPLFALAYRRKNVLEGEIIREINPLFLKYSIDEKFYSEDLVRQLLENGNIQDLKEIPEVVKRIFVTALDIPVEQHIKMQASFQRNVDNSVSKTINMPQDATVEEVKKAYIMAYDLGCKGITVFRYGSKMQQVLEIGSSEKAFEKEYFVKCDPGACRL